MATRNTPHVTVAVAVKNRRIRMLRCLDAILAQHYPSFEVLVLDNCSDDGTPEAVRERAAASDVEVRVVESPGSVGRVRNHAVELARGEVLAFTDSDCAPEPGWIAAGVRRLVSDRRLGLVQGCTLPDEPPGRLAATQEILAASPYFECCNIFFRLSAVAGAPPFGEDPRLSAFGEDVAGGWTVVRRGWRTAFEPSAVVRHDVTYPGLRWHLRRALRYEAFPALVRQFPELRDEVFWRRWFLNRRYGALTLAVVGATAAAAGRRPAALALAAPYAWSRRPLAPSAEAVRNECVGTLYDVAALIGLARGSIRYRRLVL
jgi:glycosyltransferase involved in cell wall biosynthesis